MRLVFAAVTALPAIATIASLTSARAHAQHDHHHGDHHAAAGEAGPAPRAFELGLSVIGGRFDQELYAGDYAAVGLGVAWRHGRFAVRADLPAYHLRKNGAAVDGLGDLVLGVDVLAVRAGALTAGAGLASTLPTGSSIAGLGMGHPMLMPGLWLTRDGARTTVGVSAGWCRAVGAAPEHHAQGAWPLVEPMSSSELMAGVHGELVVTGPLRAGARVAVARPLQGDPTRVVVAIGGRWRGPRAETGAELQAGLAGDPFTVRALITSAVRF